MKVNYLYLPYYRAAMKRIVLFSLVCALSGQTTSARPSFQTFDKAAFYSAIADPSLEKIENELTLVKASNAKDKEAFEGTLLMRKAGLLAHAKEKLSTFKSGYIKLERSIATDSSNMEYRFLRLIIQEHAPKVVHYDKDREKDSKAIIQSFSTLSPVLKKAILNYCPHSKLLHERELNG